MLALPLADIVVGDEGPAVLVRVGDHPLDQQPVRLLDVGAPGDLGLRLAHAHDQCVPDPLQVGGAEDPRPAGGADRPVDTSARERGGPELAQLALEPPDLAPKLVADEAFVVRSRRRGELELVVCEYLWHDVEHGQV